MSYVDLATFKGYVNVNRSADVQDDVLLQSALDAAEALIEAMTQRRFEVNVPAAAATARTFSASKSALLNVDDYTELVSVSDDGTAVDLVDLQGEGNYLQPYSTVRRDGGWSSTSGMRTITVTAKWGWAEIPAAVKQACMILAKDIVMNQQVSFGIAAFTEYAGIRAKENPQVRMLLAPYDRSVFMR